jgi:hypothetical protein
LEMMHLLDYFGLRWDNLSMLIIGDKRHTLIFMGVALVEGSLLLRHLTQSLVRLRLKSSMMLMSRILKFRG